MNFRKELPTYELSSGIYCNAEKYRLISHITSTETIKAINRMEEKAKALNLTECDYNYPCVQEKILQELMISFKNDKDTQKKYNLRFVKRGEATYIIDRNDYLSMLFLTRIVPLPATAYVAKSRAQVVR